MLREIGSLVNDRTPVDCTSVVVVADDDDVGDDDDAVADDRERPLDGSLAGVTREICRSMDGSFHLLKLPEPRARASPTVPGEDASDPRRKNAS